MTKEDILKSYLTNPLLVEKGYLKQEEVDKLKWVNDKNLDIIKVLKLAIEGEFTKEADSAIARKINQLLG